VSRILFLVSSMHGGGAERVAALLCNHWVEQGHEVILMPTFSGRGECVYPLDQRVRLDFLADHVTSNRGSLLNKVQRYFALRSAFKNLQPDVILSFLPHVNIAAVLAGWRLGIPTIVSERTYPPAMPLGSSMEFLRRFTYSKATAVVVQTERAKVWLSDCCPRATGKVIPNPVIYPLPIGEPVMEPFEAISSHKRKVLAVGRLSEEKGFDQLLLAFEQLAPRFPEWDLVILGEGPLRQELAEMCRRLGLSGRVHMPGRVGNVGAWYERSDIYVMSSRFEGFPNTLVEAMAHGLPAVSFDCATGPSDIIRQGIDGYVISPEKGFGGMAEAVGGLIKDERKRKCMGKEAALVRKRFGAKTIMRTWDEVIGIEEEVWGA